jgi:hypothetical protein
MEGNIRIYKLPKDNYLYFKSLLYTWEEMFMMALLHMAGLENSECVWKIQRKPHIYCMGLFHCLSSQYSDILHQ